MKKILFLSILFSLVGCVKSDELNDGSNESLNKKIGDKLSGTEWKVIRISKADDKTQNPDPNENQDNTDENTPTDNDSTPKEDEKEQTVEKPTVDEKSRIKFENNRIFFIIYKDNKMIDGSVYKYRLGPNGNEMFLYDLTNITELKHSFSIKNLDSRQGVSFTNKGTEEIYEVEQIK